jgi:cell cycle arrest protein BUB3
MAGLGQPLDAPPSDGVSGLRFGCAAAEQLLLVASWDCHLRLYDTALNTLRFDLELPTAVLDAAFLDAERALSGSLDKLVRLHHLSGLPEEVLGSHKESVRCVEACPQGVVCSAGWDAQLKLWEPRAPPGAGREVCTLQLPGKAMSMAASAQRLLVATSGRHLLVFDLRMLGAGATPVQRESPLKFQTRAVACSPDGASYVVASVEGRVGVDYFDDTQSAAAKYAFKCHRRTEAGREVVFPVNALAFHPLRGTFATGGCDGVVMTWDGAAKKRLAVLGSYPTSIAALAFSRDGTHLAVASSYTFESGDTPHPPDAIFLRSVQEAEVRPR